MTATPGTAEMINQPARSIAVETEIDRQIAHIRDAMNMTGPPAAALAVRQILQIRNARYHAAGYQPCGAARPGSHAFVVFRGEPTPSSEATRGLLHVVSSEALQTPRYDAAQKTIHVWLDRAYLPMLLEQLKHRRHYLWVGTFDNGHSYGDLQTDP